MGASKNSLEALHAAVADKLTESIKGMEAGDKGLAALLNVARQFVKDNHIEALPAEGSPMGNLNHALSEFPYQPSEDGKPN